MSTSKKSINHTAKTRKPTAPASSSGRKKLTPAQRREMERQQRITQALIIVGSIIVAVIFIIIFLLVYGDNGSKDLTSDTTNTSGKNDVSSVDDTVYPASEDYEIAPDGEQLKKPAKGEEVAVLETSMGTIKIRLFPKYAPTAVKNFKTLIKEGYYNGIIFHRVMNDFMIQGGDPTGTGTGGKCAFDGYETFGDEFGKNHSTKIYPVTALFQIPARRKTSSPAESAARPRRTGSRDLPHSVSRRSEGRSDRRKDRESPAEGNTP